MVVEPVWERLKNQIYLGDDAFVEKIQMINQNLSNGHDLKEVPQLQRRPVTKGLEWYEKTDENRGSNSKSF
ncbi:MAG: hypothetical protein KAH20_09675 [Methylococcales bacterium]|nr:hypothetical protein [Methylococcales bacterium]